MTPRRRPDLHRQMLARLPKQAGRWFDIRNAAGPVAVVRIYDEIGYLGVTAEDFAAELEAITAPEIEVQINSPGGEVFASIAIFNALRSHPARVTTRVDGIAASGASVIAQAGDHRVMLSGAQMMIHSAWGLAIGTAADMRDMADLLDRQTDVLASIYAERAGEPVAKFRGLLATDTWLTDTETVELGLADEVRSIDPKDGKASARASLADAEGAAKLRAALDDAGRLLAERNGDALDRLVRNALRGSK